jgi:kynureninase
VDLNLVRQKSLALGDLFIGLMEPICDRYGFELVTPKAHHLRGSQVSFRHEHGYAIVQALIADGVIGDFRAPDIARFGLTPLYLRYLDVLEATERMERVMREERWNTPQYRTRAKVT